MIHKAIIGGIKVDCIRLVFKGQDILKESETAAANAVLERKKRSAKQLTEADVEKVFSDDI